MHREPTRDWPLPTNAGRGSIRSSFAQMGADRNGNGAKAHHTRSTPRERLSGFARQSGDAQEPDRQDAQGRGILPRYPRLRRYDFAADRECRPLRAGHRPARRARPGEDAPRPLAHQPARRGGALHRRDGTERQPLRAGVRPGPRDGGGDGRRDADRLAAARPPLRREARHAGHDHRRPDRRGGPDQGRRGALSLRRD